MDRIATPDPEFVITSLDHDLEANTTRVGFEIHFPPQRPLQWDESKRGGDDMTAAKPPVRITKQRAQAFLLAADRGIDERIKDVKTKYGIVLTRDGNIEFEEDTATLLSAPAEEITEEIEEIIRAVDTLAIFRRRYG